MKVMLLQDVYNLGRAGDVKKVANGYGRNYLIPQGFAVLATPGALTQVERIREDADQRRSILNEEMAGVAESLKGVQLLFPARAGETGKLYGSVTTTMIANQLTEKLGEEITKRQIDTHPLRLLGMHTVNVRLTLDLIPEISVVVYREGEPIENYMVAAEELVADAEEAITAEAEEEAAKTAPSQKKARKTPEAAEEPEETEESEIEEEAKAAPSRKKSRKTPEAAEEPEEPESEGTAQ
jgi:large subunit ribosomal protein L9